MQANKVTQDYMSRQKPEAVFHLPAAFAGSKALSLPAVAVLKKPDAPAPVQRVINGTGVVQMNMDELIDAVKTNDKDKFKQVFRAMQPSQDEWISCEQSFRRAVHLYETEGEQAARTFLTSSDKLRFPTAFMSHYVQEPGGTGVSRFIHPTSPDTLPYGAPLSDKGNPRWINHTTFDRSRAAAVGAAASTQGMEDAAIEASTRRGVQPPYASNSMVQQSLSDDEARAAHILREQRKKGHSAFDPTARQEYDAPWYPSNAGGVSPQRDDPPDSDGSAL